VQAPELLAFLSALLQRPLFRLDGDAKAEDDGAERGVCWH